MTKLYLESEETTEIPYWNTTTTYGDDIEIIYCITE